MSRKAAARPDLAPALLAAREYGCAARRDLEALATLFAPSICTAS